MKTRKVISKKNLPNKNPILGTVVCALSMDYWNTPEWIWGAVGLLQVLLWICWIISLFNQDEIDIMNECAGKSNDCTYSKPRLSFEDRIEEEIKKNT